MDANKEADLKYIKKFKAITITAICNDLGVNKSNLYRGNASAESIRKVKEEIKKRLEELN